MAFARATAAAAATATGAARSVLTASRGRLVGRPPMQGIAGAAAWSRESAIDVLSGDERLRNDFAYALSMASPSLHDGCGTGGNSSVFLSQRQREQLAISKDQLR
ncbi:unnamed protein product [Pseudo-nitzschia multistriata]|uniref:Uncharacterized protein n=1 Tax=Pseudo-nitzschia multistriata TaxID=183589 RepID=A0A448ZC49_9STRA|nr:unnamed protein product [Pseudo-nitzschia multistriata]